MSLYSQSIKNLVAGISQQPPILRLPEQLEEQLNGFSTEVAGLQKRPPTMHIKTVHELILSDTAKPLVHNVKRDAKERYKMIFVNNTVKVIDLQGNIKPVTMADNTNPAYLVTPNPRKDLKVLTVADYTFVANKNIVTKMDSAVSPDYFGQQGVLVHVKSGQYGRTYKIFADGVEAASHTTPDGSDKSHTTQIDTAFIVSKLAAQASAKGYECETGDSWLRIKNVSTVATQDGFNNQAMIGIKDTIQRFSLLPSTAPKDYCVQVKGDPNGNDAGSYYVKYNDKEKVWEECCAPNLTVALKAATMPHALIRNGDGSFTFKALEWTERKIGDDNSNPLPSFIDRPITDIFFFRNRLGFTAGENTILSESGEFFNFWMTTANDLLDTDCIDIPATSTKVNNLHYAVPFNEDLYVFSDDSQFILRVDTVLSPKNVALPEVTSFNSSPYCRPVVAGKNLYFPTERAEFTSIKEYYTVQDVSDIKNAQDITSHVPSYIPNGVYEIVANTSENLLFILTEVDPTAIYVYKYLFANEQRVQSSWSKWDFGGTIYSAFFIESKFYFLIKRGNKIALEYINFTYDTTDYDNEVYRCFIDRKKMIDNVWYDPILERTLFNVRNEYELDDIVGIDRLALVLADGKYKEIGKKDIQANGEFYIDGNHVNKNITLGIPYVFRATLSPIYIKQQDQTGSMRSVTTGRLQLRNIQMHYSDTGGFIAIVRYKSGKTYTYSMTARTVGMTSGTIAAIPNDTGTFKFPVQTLNTNCTITIESSMPFPVALVGLLWEGTYIKRTRGG